jgi:hypothetical protein
MANILDEQERKRKELAAQGIRTRGVAGAQGGPAEMTYKPLEQRTGAEAKALGVSPQMQGQIAQEQGLIPPAALPAPAVTPSQATAQQSRGASPQAQGVTPQAQGVTPQAQAANQQLEAAREGIGSGRAASNRRLLEKAMQVSPEIRQSAKARMEWRTMTPEQRRNWIGEKKLEQEAIQVKDRIGKTTSWEQMADATGTNLDSYGNSEQFYTPDQILYKRQAQREFDKEWADVLSNVDRSAFSSPQEIYQLQEQMPSVQKYGDFLGSYRFNAIRKYASPEIRAQMEADDRNQKNVTSAFLSMTREQIAEMKERLGGEYTTMGNEDFIKEVYLNRDKDLAAGQVVDEVLRRTGRYTVENGRVVLDKPFAAYAEMLEKERVAKDAADAKEEELRALEEYEDKRYAAIQQMNPERAAMMIKNPITRKYDDLKEYAPKPPDGLPPRATTDTAYDAAKKTVQTATRQLELQQIDPIEFKKKAISDAVLFGAEDFEKQGIANIINGISADNDMSAQEIINAIAASGFGNVFNAKAFQKAMTEYEEAKNMSPQVLEARRRRAAEEAAQIERDAYGIEANAEIPVVTTQEEFDALPPGTTFVEDGVTYRKP